MALQSEESFIEKNLPAIVISVAILGFSVAAGLPYLASILNLYGLQAPNEIGDAFGGMVNPIVSLLAVFTTFFAFYIQYRANERQSAELEKQKSATLYRYVQDSIRTIKEDLKYLTYTKEKITYNYSEAIWYFMMDNINLPDSEENNFGPTFYQLSYVLTLFEPLIDEIEGSEDLDNKQKNRALQEIDGLFESSLNLILKVNFVYAEDQRNISKPLKSRLIVPAKRINSLLKSKLGKYNESVKDVFSDAVFNMKHAAFIKSARLTGTRGTVTFYKSYAEYLQNSKVSPQPESSYNNSFDTESKRIKVLVTEPVRLMSRLPFLERIIFYFHYEEKSYVVDIERSVLEDHIELDLTELGIDKELWRDEFLGKFVFDRKLLEQFVRKFIRINQVIHAAE